MGYGALPLKERVYWRMNFVALVHAIFGSTFSLWTLSTYPFILDDLLHGSKNLPIVDIGASISLGYFVYDLMIVIWYYNELPQLSSIIHHSFVISGMVACLWIYQMGSAIIAIALIEDISTVFLYIRYFMSKAGVSSSSLLFRSNQTLLYISFPLFRFAHNFYIMWCIWMAYEEIQKTSILLFFGAEILFGIVGILNTFWLFRLVYSIELFRGEIEKLMASMSQSDALVLDKVHLRGPDDPDQINERN
eukprot:TRINITY_DN5571_c0_g1_i2.p1 TRINITY_DN5571_c0_g1~~TRINITY_DN5571_c0_g1_i2.p1  ORF type:complete len:283 (-),score=31.76 TRINITY_DN5571_c0_g1_i2:36-779(-)